MGKRPGVLARREEIFITVTDKMLVITTLVGGSVKGPVRSTKYTHPGRRGTMYEQDCGNL